MTKISNNNDYLYQHFYCNLLIPIQIKISRQVRWGSVQSNVDRKVYGHGFIYNITNSISHAIDREIRQ